jgi:hypothetical protein
MHSDKPELQLPEVASRNPRQQATERDGILLSTRDFIKLQSQTDSKRHSSPKTGAGPVLDELKKNLTG